MERKERRRVPCVETLTQMLINSTIRYEVIGSECGMDAVSCDLNIPGKLMNHLMLYIPKMVGEGAEPILAEYLFERLSKE